MQNMTLSFDYDTVKNSAPTRDALTAALPETERGSFLSGAYSTLFSDRTYWDGGDGTAGHWAAAYLAEREFIEKTASTSPGFLAIAAQDTQTVTLRGEARRRSAARLFTGISPEDEHKLIVAFSGRTTFSPGMLMLTENNRLDILVETIKVGLLSFRDTCDAMNILAAPANWTAAPDFGTLLVQACHFPADHRRATRTMEAARKLQPGITAHAAIRMEQRLSLAVMEECVRSGIPLEYALA